MRDAKVAQKCVCVIVSCGERGCRTWTKTGFMTPILLREAIFQDILDDALKLELAWRHATVFTFARRVVGGVAFAFVTWASRDKTGLVN